jgi:hypothetical protein
MYKLWISYGMDYKKIDFFFDIISKELFTPLKKYKCPLAVHQQFQINIL